MDTKNTWAPERIYLQREQGEGGSHTWCEDSVGDGDMIEEVAYVRADVAALAPSDAVGAPIYQTCFIQGQWRDVDQAEYERAIGLRADLVRIVYAAPVAPAALLIDEQRESIEYAQQVLRQVEAGDGTFVGQCAEAINGLDAILAAPSHVAPAAVAPKQVGHNALVLTGAQLLEALDFIAPDRATEPEQMEATAAIAFGTGHGGEAMYIWCAEYPEEGSFVLDGKSTNAAPTPTVAADAVAPSEDAYVAQRMTETLAEVCTTIIGDDARPEDEALNAIERVKKAAQVLRLEVDLYRAQRAEAAPFQQRVQPWLMKCFGPEIAGDREERNHRFLEEALELVQALGCTASEARQLVDYTFGRPVGDPAQEVGGVMVTLAALCLANGLDMHAAGETELERISVPETVAKIRAKRAAKPKHSPLPEASDHNGEATEKAAQPDERAAFYRAAVRMLEGYAESYEAMSRMNGGENKVHCSSVAFDIRHNMAGWIKARAASQGEKQ